MARRITWLVFLAWLAVGVAIWQTATLFPYLDLDRTRDYLVLAAMAALLEMIAPGHPGWAPGSFGRLSAGFAVLLTAELVYGPAPAVWIWALATLAGQGVANRGNPLRTTIFNAAGYTLSAGAAARVWTWASAHYALGPGTVLQALVFTAAYYLAGGALRAIFQRGGDSDLSSPVDVMGWDLFTYLITLPFGLALAAVYAGTDPAKVLILFLPLLAVGLVLRRLVPARASERELAVWQGLAGRLAACGEPARAWQTVLAAVVRLIPCHAALLFLWSESGQCFQVAALRGPGRLARMRLVREQALPALLARERRPLVIPDVRRDPSLAAEAGPAQLWRSLALFPLFEGEDLTGILLLGDKKTAFFTPRHQAGLAVAAALTGLIAAWARARAALQDAGATDALTGLYDRRYFRLRAAEEAQRVRRSGTEFAVTLLSLDTMGAVGERFGAARAENILVEAARVVARLVRPADLAARYDERRFAVLMPETGPQEAAVVSGEMVNALRTHEFPLGDGTAVQMAVRAVWAVCPGTGHSGDAAGLLARLEEKLEARE